MAEIMITASIVTYKTDGQELDKVLQCVAASVVERVYVVDNSPSDELRELVARFEPKVAYIFGQGNIGYGSAHNIAIKKATQNGAIYHVVMNPDIYFENGTIEALAQYMDENPDVGQVMPKIIYPNGQTQYLCKLLPTPIDLIGRRFIPFKNYVKKRNSRFEMIQSGYNNTIQVPFLSGCFMFLRVSALANIGGFDDDYFMYCEDIDLCRRIGMSGFKTIYHPIVQVVHAHKKESFKSKTMLKAHIKSAVRYFNKWGWIFDNYRKYINRNATQQY